jgi:hypothetical protein
MNVGDTEKGGNPLSKIFGSNIPKDLATANSSNFEKELFRDGVYVFDFDREVSTAENDHQSLKDWLRHPMWVSRAQGVLADLVTSKRWDLAWKQAFSGRIPKSWSIWYGLTHSFEEAGKRGVQLSPTLVNAGVSHDHPLVVNEAGKSQKLSPEQLGLVLGRDDIPAWNSDQIIVAQRAKGMTNEEYQEARDYAVEVREKIEKARSTRSKSPSPKPQLKGQNQGGEA